MIKDAVSQKIIDATVTCIGKVGVQAITNRMVAEEAGVNHAAINYYFGSKENMIQEAIKCSLDHYLADFLIFPPADDTSKGLSNILEEFLISILRDSVSTPFFIKSYMYEPIMHGDYSGIFVERLNNFIKFLSGRSDASILGETQEEIKLVLTQIVSSVLFICLVPNFFNEFLADDLRSEEVQRDLVRSIMAHFLKTINH